MEDVDWRDNFNKLCGLPLVGSVHPIWEFLNSPEPVDESDYIDRKARQKTFVKDLSVIRLVKEERELPDHTYSQHPHCDKYEGLLLKYMDWGYKCDSLQDFFETIELHCPNGFIGINEYRKTYDSYVEVLNSGHKIALSFLVPRFNPEEEHLGAYLNQHSVTLKQP